MVQTKKPEVRDAILDAARTLFESNGYHHASMAKIAKTAGVSSANIYVYFSSKLDILFALYDPWLRARLERLQLEARNIPDPEDRLRLILKTLWHDIPGEENCFANNLMQALSTAAPEDRYSRELLVWAEQKISTLIEECLPAERQGLMGDASLAHILFMAFDGFAMNHRLNGPPRRMDHIIELTLALLMGRHAIRTEG